VDLNRRWWALVAASMSPEALHPQRRHDLLERWTELHRDVWSHLFNLSQDSLESTVVGLERAAESLVHAQAGWARRRASASPGAAAPEAEAALRG
jgi:hypothetical protein